MTWSLDARIPLVIVLDEAVLATSLAEGPPAAALLDDPDAPAPVGAVASIGFTPAGAIHPQACACCGGRPPAAAALDRLFQDRVRGRCPWFARVVALAGTAAAHAALRQTLAEDALTLARFRLAEG